MPPIKIMVAAPSLGGGGAERVISTLLRRLERGRFRPSLVLFRREGVFLADVPPDVPVFDCGRYGDGGRWRWIERFIRILRTERPDVLMSFLWETNMVAIPAARLSGVRKVLVSERVSVLGAREGRVKDFIRKIGIHTLYRAAVGITTNSRAMERQFVQDFHFPSRKVVAIPNPVDMEAIVAKGQEHDPLGIKGIELPVLAAMGRFAQQKGFDTFLTAFALLKTPSRLLLIGEGEDEKRLKTLAARLGVADRVIFTGFLSNPFPTLAGATVFVLSSRFEGFPNALVEAMTLGLPCIATKCPTGPEEIIRDGESGLLVPVDDPVAMAGAIDRLLKDDGMRGRLAAGGFERVKEFDVPSIIRQYESLIESVVA